MATWKDFVKAAQQNTVSKVTSNVIPALVPKPAPKPAPKIEYPKHYIGPSTKTPSDARAASIGPAKDRNYNPDLGFYGLLGNPGLQRALDAGYDAAQESGSTAARVAAGLGRLPERIVAAAGTAALAGGAAPVAYRALDTGLGKVLAAASKVRAPLTVGSGVVSGVKKGIETGNVADAIESGVRGASMANMMLGGGLLPSVAGLGLASASNEYRNTGDLRGSLAAGATEATVNGALGKLFHWFPKATTAGLTAYETAQAMAEERNQSQGLDEVIAAIDSEIEKKRRAGLDDDADRLQAKRDNILWGRN